MQLDRIRARIFLALGLGTVVPTLPACTSTKASPPDAPVVVHPPVDASTMMPDGPVTVRRPFLVGATLRASAATARADWGRELAAAAAPALDDATRAALAAAWTQDALEEHASIAAFSRFVLQLLAVGAPPDLIAAAQRATGDEIRHARAAFALAARYGGAEVGPGPLRVDDALGPVTLAAMAELAAEEGCVGETLGAILAADQAARATDPTARDVLAELARDELRHAELAWRFVRWAVDVGGAPVLAAVTRGMARATAGTLAAPMRRYDVDPAAWHAHGRVTCEEARAVAALGIAQIITPAATALAATVRDGQGVGAYGDTESHLPAAGSRMTSPLT